MMSHERPDDVELVAALIEAQRLAETLGVVVHVDALSLEQIVAFRDHLVPVRPFHSLVDVTPVLVIRSDAQVVPLTHEIDHRLWLGSLQDAPLHSLASRWLSHGQADELAMACSRTWTELVLASPHAAYWYDEVAARTREAVSTP
jgi:hypothetical protein